MNRSASARTMTQTDHLLQACFDLPHAWGKPAAQGVLKANPEDFVVEEKLGFEPDGSGEHLFVEIEKRGLGTLEVQRWLAERFRLPLRNVAFSGMKDKQALTRQWFSLQLGVQACRAQAGLRDEVPLAQHPGARILRAQPNRRKLQRGSHRQNRFRLRIRNVGGDRSAVQVRWEDLLQHGLPNYFGPQRFGYGGSTLLQAWQAATAGSVARGRGARSLQLSAARAFLFNRVLATRVADGSWQAARPGDLMQLAGSASLFAGEREEPSLLAARLSACDVHPTGPMWGRGEPMVSMETAQLESETVAHWHPLCSMLENAGLQQERRALRTLLTEASLAFEGSDLHLTFTLGRGSYATAVVRELLQTDTVAESNP